MPKLVRLYILHVLIGFGISAAFCVTIVWLNVAGLRHLVLETDMGWVAAVMLLAEDDEGPRGGRRQRVAKAWLPVAIPAREKPAMDRRPR